MQYRANITKKSKVEQSGAKDSISRSKQSKARY